MKKSFPYIFLCLAFLLFCCKKLERDNPLDNNCDSSERGIKFSKYDISSDNNEDGQINKGESVKLIVYLKNTGSSTANKVIGTISCSSNYVSDINPTTDISFKESGVYDYISAGLEGFSYYPIEFNVSSSTPAGTVITFNISISDEANNNWTSCFSITVVTTGASIAFSRYGVDSDNNGDGQINKGESIKLIVYIENTGSSTANKVIGTISCSSNYVSDISPTTDISFKESGVYVWGLKEVAV